MMPLVVLVGVWIVGLVAALFDGGSAPIWQQPLAVALACMLLLTASAHFTTMRGHLVASVPRMLPAPGFLVTVTGVLEILVAAGLLVPAVRPWAAWLLAALLVVMFPANVRAARKRLPLGRGTAMGVRRRGLIQVAFLVAAVAAAV